MRKKLNKPNPLPSFILDNEKIIIMLRKIIIDINKNSYSKRCPCRICYECVEFFTHMQESSTCPCYAIKLKKVSKEFVLERLAEAIERLKNQKD